MAISKAKGILFSLLTFLGITGISLALIAYGRGYRVDLTKNSLKSTGLLAATSDPIGAQVYVEGELNTATNNSINVEPGWYTVRIDKEGYISWQKKLLMQPEIVTRADAFLFPANPSLSPVTATGIEKPQLSPDGTKVAYTIPLPKNADPLLAKKAGLWVYELVERTLGRNRDPKQIGTSDSVFNFSIAQIVWSPDSREIMATNGVLVRLYDLDRLENIQLVTNSYKTILAEWESQRLTKERQKLLAFKQPIIDMATKSARIISFSPDESKILYQATAAATIPPILVPPLIGTNSTEEARAIVPEKFYVYDAKEDKNYFVMDKTELPQIKATPTPTPRKGKQPQQVSSVTIDQYSNIIPLHWFPTSRHLVLTLEGKIDIMEYDRTNWITIYSGPFVDGFFAPWPNGSRIIILTNFNDKAGSLPNLYTVNLR